MSALDKTFKATLQKSPSTGGWTYVKMREVRLTKRIER